MQTARPTSSTHEQTVNRATVQRTRRWETTCTTVNWDYPPPPTAYYNALLARGASHSRFLRIAYLTKRERSCPSPSSPTPSLDTPASPTSPPQLSSILPHLLSRPYANTNPRSGNPPPHTLKRRKPHWPKPPYYHASLLRSPLSRRKGLFRAVLAPSKAVDFVRWDIFAGAGSFSNQPSPACTSLRVAECVLEPYEAAAGFSGWHGLGIDVTRRVQGKGSDDECPWSGDVEPCRPAGECGSDLRHDIDEATVDEGRARWACLAEELVGPPGIALRWIQGDKSGKGTAPLYPVHGRGAYAREEVRWDPDIGSSPFRPPRATPAPDEKRRLAPSTSTTSISGLASGFKPQLKIDSPSAWWYAPSSHRGPPPHLHPLRFPHTPHVQYGPPPLQFPPYFPSRLASAQGHGDWYSVQPTGAPSVNRDSNPVKSHPPHSHSYLTPIHVQSSKCPRHSLKSSLGRDEDHDCDKEAETDHDYESTTTTTDSDPPPHTPIGATTTSHCVEAPQLHGDDEVGIDTERGPTALRIGLSDPTTPVKLLPRFATSPSVSSSSPDLNRAGHESSKAAVVFPSLNGSFRQGSLSQMSVFSSNQGMSTPTMPARVAATASLTSLSSNDTSSSDEDNSKMPPEDGESLACSPLHDNPAFMLSLSSPPPTSPGSALRKNSQGLWAPVTLISPCSSLSSLPLSPSEDKIGARPKIGRIGEKKGPVPGNTSESPDANGSQGIYPTKCRSLSPGPRRDTSADSSLSIPTAVSSPTSTPASVSVFGGSYPCSPSNGAFLIPPNPTTLLPAFLATTGGKRKKASRTREIVDQLRSSSIDAGKGVDGLGWLAGAGAGGEPDGMADKASDYPVESHVAGQPSPSSPPKSRPDSGSDLGKNHGQAGSRTCDSSSRGSGGKSNGTTMGSETSSPTATRPATSMTPFPILSVSQTSPSNLTMAHRNQSASGTSIAPFNAGDGAKTNATVTTSPNVRSQLLPDTPNGGTSPSMHHSHHPLPSPTHPTVHLQPVLGPPILAVAAYPPPMYVPYTQYSLAPPPQQQGQGGWVAIYPGRPAHIPVHPIPHVTHITGVSGMRHVSW